MHKAVDNLLAVGMTLRLTRVMTSDMVGEWWFVAPAKRWAARAEARADRWAHSEYRARQAALGKEHTPMPPLAEYDGEPRTWQAKLVKGLECPFCVGFWLGAAVLTSLAIARSVPPLLPIWRAVASVFSLNYVVGHIGARLD